MSTYYKETLSGQPIYRVAAARMTYERLNGTIGEVDFDAAGGGAGSWADVEAFVDFPAVIAAGATQAEARTAIGAVGAGANSTITSLTGLTTPLSLAQGGTGVTTINDLASGLNIAAFMPGIAPQISNLDTWTIGGIRTMTLTTVGRPTGTVADDIVMNFVSATRAAQFAFLTTAGKLVFRVFNGTAWQPWQDITHTALA